MNKDHNSEFETQMKKCVSQAQIDLKSFDLSTYPYTESLKQSQKSTMRQTIISQDDKVFKTIEWIFFIVFSIVAVWFASGVLEQFFSQKTSFSQHEETVTDYPVVSIVLLGYQASEVNLNNIEIKYGLNGMKNSQKLEIGENHFQNDDFQKTENVILESLEDANGCKLFQIIHTTKILKKKRPTVIITMNTKVEKDTKDLVKFYLTSRKNSPGVFDETWIDGTPLLITLNKNTLAVYNMQPQLTRYLPQLGKCQEESYYECISSQIDDTEFSECFKKCIPNLFSSMGRNYSTPFCQNDTDNERCIAKQVYEKNLESNCKKSCTKLEYFGEMEIYQNVNSKDNKSNNYRIFYRLTNNNFEAKVYEEYLIYDTIGMIGSVGGTLGMLDLPNF